MGRQVIKRQRLIAGAIHEIDIEGMYYVYTQVVHKEHCLFFDYKTTEHLSDIDILKDSPILFQANIYNDCITKGYWPRIGKLPIRKEYLILPNEFIYNSFDKPAFHIYNPNTWEITPSNREACQNLERAAIWARHHIVDRIRNHYNGEPCLWLREDYDLFPERLVKLRP